MASGMKKVTGGSPLRIPASAYNAFVDAAQAHIESQSRGGAGNIDFLVDRNNPVPIRNDTDKNLLWGEILGIEEPLFLPELNEGEFQSKIQLIGILPMNKHAEKLAILAEPIPKGEIGFAWVSGLCPTKVYVLNEEQTSPFTTAGIIEGETLSLSAGAGNIPILWKETGIGTKWAIVRLGGGGGSGSAVEHVVVRNVYETLPDNPTEDVKVEAVDRGPLSGIITVVGDPFFAQAKPGLKSADYYPFMWQGPIHQRLTRFLPCYKIRGAWRLGWEPDILAEILPPDVRITDCIPASRAGRTT